MNVYIVTSYYWVREHRTHANCILRVYKDLDDAINYLSYYCDYGEEHVQLTDGCAEFEGEDGTLYTITEHSLE